jgi:hypothetical protein
MLGAGEEQATHLAYQRGRVPRVWYKATPTCSAVYLLGWLQPIEKHLDNQPLRANTVTKLTRMGKMETWPCS